MKILHLCNLVYTIGVNGLGSKNNFCGHSLAVNPSGEIMEQITKKAGSFMVSLDKKRVEARRKESPWLELRDPKTYEID